MGAEKNRLEVLMKASVAPGPYMHGYGITLRQHFAGLAMQGLCARPANHLPEDIAPLSVAMADALLAELAKDPQP